MRAGAGHIRPRWLAALAACALLGSACGNATPAASNAAGSTAGAGSSQAAASVGAGESPAAAQLYPSTATLDDMNVQEAADVRAMREELGLEAVLGADTAGVLDFIEDAGEQFAQEVFPKLLEKFGLQLAAGAPGGVQLARIVLAADITTVSLRDQVSSYVGIGTMLIPSSDKDVTGTHDQTKQSSQTVGETKVDQTESLHLELTTGEGSIEFLVRIDSSTKTTTGTLTGLVNGTGTGSLKVNSCPDEAGTVTGSVEFKISELASLEGATSSSDVTVKADFTLSVSAAAKLSGIKVQTTTSGGGIGGGRQWTAGGTSSFGGGSPPTSTSSGATPAQAARVTGSAAYAAWAVTGIALQAEDFWRSGKCVDMRSSVESKTVAPKEKVKFTVEPRGKWDQRPIGANVDVKFAGKESLDPSSGSQPPPVSFTYTAGAKKDDKGTVSLEQTSNRGIGRKTITLTVGEQDYRVNYAGGYVYSGTKCKGLAGAWTLQLSVGGGSGTVVFTIPESLGPAVATTNYKLSLAGTTSTYNLVGTVTPGTEADGSAFLSFSLGSGTITTKSKNGTITLPISDPTTDHIPLEAGSFCAT